MVVFITWNPDNRCYSSFLCRDADLHRHVHVHGVVFHIDEEPVKACRIHDLGHVDRSGLTQTDTDRQFAGSKFIQGSVFKFNHGSISGSVGSVRGAVCVARLF